MAKIIQMPQRIDSRYCQWRGEYVDTSLHGSKNGSINNVCLAAANCKRAHLCDAIRMPQGSVKFSYIKCCGVCDRLRYCKHQRKTYKSVKEPAFISAKERED